MIIKQIENVEKEKLTKFKQEYYNLYPDYLQEELDEKLLLGFTNNNDIINQIYCYLNLIEENINPYLEFYNILNNNFDLKNMKILEVGCGFIPILSKIFSDNNISIDIIDPLVTFKTLNAGKVLNEKFSIDTNIDNYDLIIGYNPCGATENMIRKSITESKDFCIFLCGCCFLPADYTDRTPDRWHKYLYDLATELSNGKYEIKFIYFDKKYNLEYPIIIGKKAL